MEMKKQVKLVMVVFIILLLNVSNSYSAKISFNQIDTFDSVGDSVRVDLEISGLGAGEPDSVGAFDLYVEFNPSILSFSGYLLGPDLGDISLGEATDYSFPYLGGDVVNVSEVSWLEADESTCSLCEPPYLDDIQEDSFSLATLAFEILSVEKSLLNINSSSWVVDAFGYELSLDVAPGAVSPVPEPATVLLLITGMGVFGKKKIGNSKT